MEINEIRKLWQSQQKSVEDTMNLWNSAAEAFNDFEVPTPENSHFLNLLKKEGILEHCDSVLDIGCGTGPYAIGLSAYCRKVTGFDLAPRMIALAKKNAQSYKKDNVEFMCGNWMDVDLKEAGLYKNHDFVFTHMTEAIGDAAAFEKMIAASKKWCALVNTTRRRGEISDTVDALVGARNFSAEMDMETLYAVSLLWLLGYEPHMDYEEKVWERQVTLEEEYALYVNRTQALKEITETDKTKIREYLESKVENGMITDRVYATIVTIYWRTDTPKNN